MISPKVEVSARYQIFDTNPDLIRHCKKLPFKGSRVISVWCLQIIASLLKCENTQISVTECFLTCFWRFLIFNRLEQLELKLEKKIGIQKHAGKFRKKYVLDAIQKKNLVNFETFCPSNLSLFNLSGQKIRFLFLEYTLKWQKKCFSFPTLLTN